MNNNCDVVVVSMFASYTTSEVKHIVPQLTDIVKHVRLWGGHVNIIVLITAAFINH